LFIISPNAGHEGSDVLCVVYLYMPSLVIASVRRDPTWGNCRKEGWLINDQN